MVAKRALVREAWQRGVHARAASICVDKNPYPKKSKPWFAWRRGYWYFDEALRRKSNEGARV